MYRGRNAASGRRSPSEFGLTWSQLAPLKRAETTHGGLVGREGELVKPMTYSGRRLAVFTSGGDSQGQSQGLPYFTVSAIVSAARAAAVAGHLSRRHVGRVADGD